MSKQHKDIKVGLICIGEGIGDTIISSKALFVAKEIFGAKCVLFGAKIAQNLCKDFSFIDEIVILPNIKQGYILNEYEDKNPHIVKKKYQKTAQEIAQYKKQEQNLINEFNKHSLDYLIIGSPRARNIKLAKATNAKKIFCALKFDSFLSLKCKTLPVYAIKSYQTKSFEEILCLFVRLINPKIYDEKISSLDFSSPTSAMRLRTNPTHKQYINEFLAKSTPQILSTQNLANKNNKKHLVMINPFSVSGDSSLSINGFFDIIASICNKYKNSIALVATYPKVHHDFLQAKAEYEKHTTLENLVIFPNNDDIFNLVELLSRVTCLISPSTGTAHLAANVGIPTIALYGKRDMNRWLLGGGTHKC